MTTSARVPTPHPNLSRPYGDEVVSHACLQKPLPERASPALLYTGLAVALALTSALMTAALAVALATRYESDKGGG
ncbi:MAG: hypothetical protein ACJ8AG_23785 [Ktedonobacteraceae bacterium]